MRFPQLPSALRWDHNARYHRWLLRRLPERLGTALDLGCGTGELANQLAERAHQVDAVDVSAEVIRKARERSAVNGTIRWWHGDALDPALPLSTYSLVTAHSSMHHMPLRPALARMAELVAPGGVLAVLGHYRPAALGDYALNACALPANAAIGAVLAARGRPGTLPEDEGMPVMPPTTTLAEIRAAAKDILPRADRMLLRRHLFWRYSLLWRRPPART